MARSALVIVISSVVGAVEDLRQLHDPMAARGVPPHVTVLHPFMDVVDDVTSRVIGEACSTLSPFTATFSSVGRFPGEVVFLEPEPIERFVALTRRFAARFPDHPPYGGRFGDSVPHLTIGNGVSLDTAEQLDLVIDAQLPLSCNVTALTLLVEDDEGRWTIARDWPFAGAST